MSGLFDVLRNFKNRSFREIYKKFIYIHCRDLMDEIFPGELDDKITGFIAYCYIDRTEGLSFKPVAIAALTERSMQVFVLPHLEDTVYILRLREGCSQMSEAHENGRNLYLYALDPVKYSFFDLKIVGFDAVELAEIQKGIDEVYFAGDSVEELRSKKYAFLDKYRHEFSPDDVKVLLYDAEHNKGEQVWVRLMTADEDGGFTGELMNEPYEAYGCHKGDVIELIEQPFGSDGDTALFFSGWKSVIL